MSLKNLILVLIMMISCTSSLLIYSFYSHDVIFSISLTLNLLLSFIVLWKNSPDEYLVKLSILGKDKSEVRTIRDALEPFINGFNGISLNDEIAIMIDDYRVETRATDANYEVGAFDLTIFHKQGA